MILFPRKSMIFGGLQVILLIRNTNVSLIILSNNILFPLPNGYCRVYTTIYMKYDTDTLHMKQTVWSKVFPSFNKNYTPQRPYRVKYQISLRSNDNQNLQHKTLTKQKCEISVKYIFCDLFILEMFVLFLMALFKLIFPPVRSVLLSDGDLG